MWLLCEHESGGYILHKEIYKAAERAKAGQCKRVGWAAAPSGPTTTWYDEYLKYSAENNVLMQDSVRVSAEAVS